MVALYIMHGCALLFETSRHKDLVISAWWFAGALVEDWGIQTRALWLDERHSYGGLS